MAGMLAVVVGLPLAMVLLPWSAGCSAAAPGGGSSRMREKMSRERDNETRRPDPGRDRNRRPRRGPGRRGGGLARGGGRPATPRHCRTLRAQAPGGADCRRWWARWPMTHPPKRSSTALQQARSPVRRRDRCAGRRATSAAACSTSPRTQLRACFDEAVLPHLVAARHLLPWLAESGRNCGYVVIGGPGGRHPWAGYGHRSVAAAAVRMLARVLHSEARTFAVRLQLLEVESPVRTDANEQHACKQWPCVDHIGRKALLLLEHRNDARCTEAVIDYRSEACGAVKQDEPMSKQLTLDRRVKRKVDLEQRQTLQSCLAAKLRRSKRKKWIAPHPCCHHAVCRTCASCSKPSPPRKRIRSVPDEPQETCPVRTFRRSRFALADAGGQRRSLFVAIAGCGSQASHRRGHAAAARSQRRQVLSKRCVNGTNSPAASPRWKPSSCVRASAATSARGVQGRAGGHKGDLLFVIDQRPYRAALDRAQAELERARSEARLAHAGRARADTDRGEGHLARGVRNAQGRTPEQRRGARRRSRRRRRATRSAVHRGAFADRRPRRPRAGDRGNLAQADATLLTTVVSLDPVYVYFDSDEQSFLRYNELARKGERSDTTQSGARRPGQRDRLSARGYGRFRRQPGRSAHRHDPCPRRAAEPGSPCSRRACSPACSCRAAASSRRC